MLSKEALREKATQRHIKVHKPTTDLVVSIYAECEDCLLYVEKEERAGDFWRQVYVCSIHNQLPAEDADAAVREAKVRGYL